MSTLASVLSSEVLEDALLTLEQITPASRCLLSMPQGTQSSRPGCGCFWVTCWRISRTVRTSWGLMPPWMPEHRDALLSLHPSHATSPIPRRPYMTDEAKPLTKRSAVSILVLLVVLLVFRSVVP